MNSRMVYEVEDTNPLEPGADPDARVYYPDTGIVIDGNLELVENTKVNG